jgi:hypothetical protein
MAPFLIVMRASTLSIAVAVFVDPAVLARRWALRSSTTLGDVISIATPEGMLTAKSLFRQ